MDLWHLSHHMLHELAAKGVLDGAVLLEFNHCCKVFSLNVFAYKYGRKGKCYRKNPVFSTKDREVNRSISLFLLNIVLFTYFVGIITPDSNLW